MADVSNNRDVRYIYIYLYEQVIMADVSNLAGSGDNEAQVTEKKGHACALVYNVIKQK